MRFSFSRPCFGVPTGFSELETGFRSSRSSVTEFNEDVHVDLIPTRGLRRAAWSLCGLFMRWIVDLHLDSPFTGIGETSVASGTNCNELPQTELRGHTERHTDFAKCRF